MHADPPAKMTIRPARPGEHAMLEHIMRRASLVSDKYRDQLLAHPEAMSLPAAQIEGGTVFVAELDGAVAGFCAVVMTGSGEAELDGLFVEPMHWGEGIGRALAGHGADAARKLGAVSITVIAGPETQPFYETCGFAYQATAKTLFGPAVLMRRRLGGR